MARLLVRRGNVSVLGLTLMRFQGSERAKHKENFRICVRLKAVEMPVGFSAFHR